MAISLVAEALEMAPAELPQRRRRSFSRGKTVQAASPD
jgi:hypothetical protein